MNTWKERFHFADQLLREARVGEALALLPKRERLSRGDRLLAANLARRTSQIDLGLRLLHPALFSETQKPNEGEIAEYAVLLSLNGGVKEASRWLDSIEQPKLPATFLARAWCLFAEWRFAHSIPFLQTYLELQNDPYYRFAGQINLTEALFETSAFQECRLVLQDVLATLSRTPYARLRANALHIESMLLHAMGDLEGSDRSLNLAFELIKTFETTDKFLLHRQRAINLATKTRDVHALDSIRARAAKMNAWDSLRKIDFEALKIQFDSALYRKLLFGSPFEDFVRQLKSAFPEENEITRFRWGAERGACLDLASGKQLSGRGAAWTGQSLTLLRSFTKDLYTPMRLGDLFTDLYPGEHFHLVHSPNRVRQSLHRFRKFLKEGKWSLKLSCRGGYYSLKPLHGFSVLLARPDQSVSKSEQLESLISSQDPFTRRDVMELMGLPKSSAHRLLEQEIAQNSIKRIGRGRNVRYVSV